MAKTEKAEIKPYDGPAGGWGSVKAVGGILTQEEVLLLGSEILWKQNKPDGFMCVSCAWAKPANHRPFEFCENGAKATAWEITNKKSTPEFFAEHSLSELRGWSDHELEENGRLTHPLRYDASSDRYLPVTWHEAFREIGAELKRLDPKSVILYMSGRASLEASFMYQLFGRLYGTNNFPDSSNMCHESTSVALPEVIGVPVGTVLLKDFETTDLILFFGQNTTTNSPRMLHELEAAAKRNVPIITFNPLRERGLERFINPQNPLEMLSLHETRISSSYYQINPGSDMAAIAGICKAVLALDEAAERGGGPRIIDIDFIAQHTAGFEDFSDFCRAQDWSMLESLSGMRRDEMEDVALIYSRAERVIVNYGMGITQHHLGVDTIKMIVNLMLLRGNIGKPGAGISPVRGHSNVQGQRTVGITEKTKLVPLDKLAERYEFEPPREDGWTTVDACNAIIAGEASAVISMGGNLARSMPERARLEPAWQRLQLSVQIATKLNRTHLLPGQMTYLLPCLGRIEIDRQESGPQVVSMEDSTACIHGSTPQREPVSEHLLSEPKIIAELAKATLPPNPKIDWDRWVGQYFVIRDEIEAIYPDQFQDFNSRLFTPGGFARPLPARERMWKTKNDKANFTIPAKLDNRIADGPDIYQLMTLRADGQFNTTIYNESDRFRGVEGGRMVLLMNVSDIERLGLLAGMRVTLTTAVEDGFVRKLSGLQVVPYSIPEKSVAGYYPECNVLIPVWHHASEAKVPAAKSIPVRIAADEVT
jgi:molybdopterin-dependent oxidoreductase alpha subunit